MILELSGIFMASVLGSWHCAGMCGPFGVFLRNARHPTWVQVAYHVGRLAAYGVLLTALSWLSEPLRRSLGQVLYLALLVFWLVVLVGEFGRWNLKPPRWMGLLLQRLSKASSTPGSEIFSGLGLGLGTGLIPCGWLYGFVIVAASYEKWESQYLVLGVFWAGTIPALWLTRTFLGHLSQNFRKRARWASLLLVFATGVVSFVTHKNLWSPAGTSCSLHSH